MTKVLVTEGYLNDIAEAIRSKNGATTTYRPGDMADAIEALDTSGIHPTGTKSITANGTHDVTQYASANVNVPNSYSASDEGKVVDNGALVAQTSRNVTANGTYDTTTNDEVVVNVPSGGGGGNTLLWSAGDYIGSPEGNTVGSLSFTLNGAVGIVAVLVVMHRSSLTVPSGWTLLDHRDNPMTAATGNIPQQISLLKRVMEASTESFTIAQASASVRMNACVFYFSDEPGLTYVETKAMTPGAQYFTYDIDHQNTPTLVVISNPYTITDRVINTMMPEMLYAAPANVRYFNTGSSIASPLRMLAIIDTSPISLSVVQQINVEESSASINRAFLYSIGGRT